MAGAFIFFPKYLPAIFIVFAVWWLTIFPRANNYMCTSEFFQFVVRRTAVIKTPIETQPKHKTISDRNTTKALALISRISPCFITGDKPFR